MPRPELTLGQATPLPDASTGSGRPVKATVRVLGVPEVVNRPAEVSMRGYASEILVYLAVHADGATPEDILDDMWPGERRRITATRLHTGVSNLRKVLAASIDADPANFVTKHHGRYRLNPDAVDVDLWQLRAVHTAARRSEDIVALQRVCDSYTGPLAVGKNYAWVEPYRQGTLNLAIDAYTRLAATLMDTDPAGAAKLLDAAIGHDPTNENLYQQAMRAHHRNGDIKAVAARLQQLRAALRQIGAEPTEQTERLSRELVRTISRT
jgi:DNA-binding SARP family transcriptional activator